MGGREGGGREWWVGAPLCEILNTPLPRTPLQVEGRESEGRGGEGGKREGKEGGEGTGRTGKGRRGGMGGRGARHGLPPP